MNIDCFPNYKKLPRNGKNAVEGIRKDLTKITIQANKSQKNKQKFDRHLDPEKC